MYHPRFKGSHYEMGIKMGNIFKKADVVFPVKLDSFQRDFGRKSGKILKKYFPEATEEIRGITDIIGIDNELFTSWMMCMGCCLDISEGNSIEARGCTAFSFMYNGEVYHARNNDLPPFLRKISKSICYKPESGNGFILNTSSFINGEEGINNHGLVAAMTFVKPQLDEIKPGINSVFLVRYILEKCKTVNEGINALKNLPTASSCNIILTDKSGEMIVAECNPFEMNIRQPDKNNAGENFIVTVNNFTSEKMKKHDSGSSGLFFSKERYETAVNALKHIKYNEPLEHAKKLLSGRFGFMCQYEKSLDFDTIWSSVFDISGSRIYRAEGNPSSISFVEDERYIKYIVDMNC